jgi:hypothetical protein
MLTHNSPVESANFLADYINANVSAFPEHLKTPAIEAVREASPVARMAKGIEVVFAVVVDEAAPERETGLNALASSSLQVAEGNFWGLQDRAISFMKWTRLALGEWPEGIDAPEVPAVDAAFVAPAPAWPDEAPEIAESEGETTEEG